MKNRAIILCAVIFSAFGFAFPSNIQKTERLDSAENGALCNLQTLKQTIKSSSAIFAGKLVGEEKKGDYRIFRFAVQRYWKGTKAKNITIEVYETPRFQARFEIGEEYLIYADQINGKLQIGRCSRFSQLSAAQSDLKSLGKGKKSK